MLIPTSQDYRDIQRFRECGEVDIDRISALAFRSIGETLYSSTCEKQLEFVILGKERFPGVVRSLLYYFPDLDEEFRFQIFVEMLAKDFLSTASSNSSFKLSDERLVEAAKQFPNFAARYRQYLGIRDEQISKEFDAFLVEKAPLECFRNLRNFSSEDPFAIARAAVNQDPVGLSESVRGCHFTKEQNLELLYAAVRAHRDCIHNASEFFTSLSREEAPLVLLNDFLGKNHPLVDQVKAIRSLEAKSFLIYLIVKHLEPSELAEVKKPLDTLLVIFEKVGEKLRLTKQYRHDSVFIQSLIILSSFSIELGAQGLISSVIKSSEGSTTAAVKKLMLCTTYFRLSKAVSWKGSFEELSFDFKRLIMSKFGVEKGLELYDFFLQFRIPMAPLTYFASIERITDEDKKKTAFMDFFLFLEEAVSGSLEVNRLKSLQDVVESSLLEKWSKGEVFEGEGYSLEDTSSPHEILIMGTEILSCQSITHTNTNLGVLGKLLNGYNRIVILKENNRQVKRVVIRLMQQGGKLVLFMERLYKGLSKLSDRLLFDFVKKRAKALGLPLIQSETLKEKLHTLPGRAHFEHTDAGGGAETSSKFSINPKTQVS